ncbi:AraC family transcriptional regulator [Rhizobium sp. NFR03]|uniref:AraC family transcriptional regulator n=1 Tax=Rhizobium sp. NFR03 TaxID=1566263 RepID=UPI0008CD8A0D|nr:AraC family transcriptional regulator [Rhizobium sp. NFR03]SES34342.1 AraC-type DNA-binding protein [Rhizobium sp. NFR03]
MFDPSAARRQPFVEIIARFASEDGDHTTSVPGLTVHRRSEQAVPSCGAYRPSFALIAQGAKKVTLGHETYVYGGSDYLLTSFDLPVTSQIVQASPESPYLGMVFEIDVAKIPPLLALLERHGATGESRDDPARVSFEASASEQRGMTVAALTPELEDAALRLLRLLDRPGDIPALLPLIEQELIFRLLTGPHAARLRQMAMVESQSHQIGRACAWLKEHYALPLRIEDLARRVSMSVSSLHHHFKAITAMSPMQYQKQLRLQEARRLMVEDKLDAGSAGHQVGYESPSQFSREYARQFGAPPLRDAGRTRRSLLGRLAGEPEMLSEG